MCWRHAVSKRVQWQRIGWICSVLLSDEERFHLSGIPWPVRSPDLTVHISSYGKKVKCTLVQALRLCTGRTAYRGSRGIALLFLDHSTRWGWGVSVTPWPLFTPGKDPVPIIQKVRWAPGPVWRGAENLAPTGIRSPDRTVRSQSLYRLSFLGPLSCLSGYSKIMRHGNCPHAIQEQGRAVRDNIAVIN